MEINEEVRQGLLNLSNETIISDDNLKLILTECLAVLGKPSVNKYICQTYNTNKLDVLKLVQYSLISLFTENIKNGEEQDLYGYLTHLKIPQGRAELISKAFEDSKMNILKNISNFNDNTIPHISDVVWKLDYVLKNNETLEKDLLYRIQLINNDEPVNFNCNIDQLQDLLFKLKDIHNHCSKLANSNT